MFRRGNALVVALVNLAGNRSRVSVIGHTRSFWDKTLLLRLNRSPNATRFSRFNREPSPRGPDAARVGVPQPRWGPGFSQIYPLFCKFGKV